MTEHLSQKAGRILISCGVVALTLVASAAVIPVVDAPVHTDAKSKPLGGPEFRSVRLLIPRERRTAISKKLEASLLDGGLPASRLARGMEPGGNIKAAASETGVPAGSTLFIIPGCRGLRSASPGKASLPDIDERVKQWRQTIDATHILARYLTATGWKAHVEPPDNDLPLGTIAVNPKAGGVE